MERLQIDVER